MNRSAWTNAEVLVASTLRSLDAALLSEGRHILLGSLHHFWLAGDPDELEEVLRDALRDALAELPAEGRVQLSGHRSDGDAEFRLEVEGRPHVHIVTREAVRYGPQG